MIEIIKNAATLYKRSTGGRLSEHGKALLELKVGQGFKTDYSKSLGLRALASRHNIQITVTVKGEENGKCVVIRLA